MSPEGTGYRAKTRFAKFHNLPELMNLFKEIADILTDRGYTCKVTQSTPTLERGIYCTRLYVTWDNKSSGSDI